MDYIRAFLIGGGVISGAKYVSTYLNPLYGSIVGGMPTGIISSLFLEDNEMESYYESYAYHSVLLALTINVIYQLNRRTRIDKRLISIVGLLVWGAMSLILVRYYLMK